MNKYILRINKGFAHASLIISSIAVYAINLQIALGW